MGLNLWIVCDPLPTTSMIYTLPPFYDCLQSTTYNILNHYLRPLTIHSPPAFDNYAVGPSTIYPLWLKDSLSKTILRQHMETKL